MSAVALSVSSCSGIGSSEFLTQPPGVQNKGAVKVAGPNTSRPNVTLRYRLSSAPRDVSNGRMPTTRAAYPEIAPETRTVAAQVFSPGPIHSDTDSDADAGCCFPSKSEAQAIEDTFPVLVAISLVCVPEDGCSSAKVLVTETDVGPGT